MVFAMGYEREAVFPAGLQFSGFNPNSSYIQTSAPDGQPYPSDLSNNLAYQLYLAGYRHSYGALCQSNQEQGDASR